MKSTEVHKGGASCLEWPLLPCQPSQEGTALRWEGEVAHAGPDTGKGMNTQRET